MAIIPQPSLFSWKEIEAASDLDRLRLVLWVLDDEGLMRKLEARRGGGCDTYPVRPVWNSILAGVVFEHPSVEALRRELLRNGELRDLCGFDPLLGSAAAPTARAYSNFFANLFKLADDVEAMFDGLVEELRSFIPELGKNLAADGKALDSAGKPSDKAADGRRETDADWGKKTYRGVGKDAKAWEKVKSWFGFKLHLVVDADCELPLAFEVTQASTTDTERLLPLMEKLCEKHPGIVEESEHCMLDKGYDSAGNNAGLLDGYGVKPVGDTREMWKDGEKTRPLYPERADNIVYDERGGLWCEAVSKRDAKKTERRSMAYAGFEADRRTLKYRCPAAAYGFECPERSGCGNGGGAGAGDYGRIVRVPLEIDRRIFVPVPRDSPKWERHYKKRTAVERVNSRLDVSFGFERHYIRGLRKMKVRIGLALVVMLAMALGSLKLSQAGRMRSLVKPVEMPEAA